MQTGDAACKMMRCIKESRVAIGNLRALADETVRNAVSLASRLVTLLQQLRRTSRPDSPMTQEAAHDAVLFGSPGNSQNVRRDQIHHDVVIVAGIQSDV